MARRYVGLGLLCFACASGQIGGEVGHTYPADEAFQACDVVSEVPVAADDPDLAFDLAATIDAISGTHAVETLSWAQHLANGLGVVPEPGQSEIQIEIHAVPDSALRLERQSVMDDAPSETNGLSGATGQDDASACPALLAFEAEVTVSTENGALSDTFNATFVAQSPYLATAAFQVVPAEITGNFALEPGEGEMASARFELAWADGRVSGYLAADVTTDEDTVSNVEIARFPSDGCSEGRDLPATSALVDRAQAFVSELDHFALDWPDGASTELTLAPDFGPACLGFGTPISVVLPMGCAVESADGGIDGRWNLSAVVGFDDQGDVAWAEISRADYAVSPAGEFAKDTGITGISVDAERAATFDLQLGDQRLDEQPAGGTLTVLESHPAVCDTAPDEPLDGGTSTPGCSGYDMIELGTATLTRTD